MDELEEVDIGIEGVLDLLQACLCEGAHGVADAVEASPAREDDEALEQFLAAGDLLQSQVWHAVRKLHANRKAKEREDKHLSPLQTNSMQSTQLKSGVNHN